MTTTLLTVHADLDRDLPGLIALHSDYRVKDSIKAVPGAKWDSDKRVWTVPLSWTSCLALRAELGDSLLIGGNLKEWATDEREKKTRLADLRNRLEIPGVVPDLPGFADLYPYQLVGAEAIRLAGSYMLLDETGAGKTRTALAGLALLVGAGETVLPAADRLPEDDGGDVDEGDTGFLPPRHGAGGVRYRGQGEGTTRSRRLR